MTMAKKKRVSFDNAATSATTIAGHEEKTLKYLNLFSLVSLAKLVS